MFPKDEKKISMYKIKKKMPKFCHTVSLKLDQPVNGTQIQYEENKAAVFDFPCFR